MKKILIILTILTILLSMSQFAFASVTPDPVIHADLKTVFDNPPKVDGYPYQELLAAAADRYGLSLPFLLAVVRGESFFDPQAKSAKGAIGLMQVMPSTAEQYGLVEADLFLPERNIDAGVHYLSDLYTDLQDPYLTLAAYYCGPGGVSGGDFTLRKDCNEYVHYIYQHLKKIVGKGADAIPAGGGTEQRFALTEFDNFLDAEQFTAFLGTKLPQCRFDIFRRDAVRPDHVRYRYQIMASGRRVDICRQVEQASGFSFCREQGE